MEKILLKKSFRVKDLKIINFNPLWGHKGIFTTIRLFGKKPKLILVEELSRIYSTLKDKENQTELMLELGKLKSINVYFSGQIETPGIHLIHPILLVLMVVGMHSHRPLKLRQKISLR